MYGRVVAIGDDERPVILARKELVVRADDIGLTRAVEAALCLVDIRGGDGDAHVFKRQAVGCQGRGIGMNADRRPLAAGEAHEPDAGQLGNFLREPRVRHVFDLRQGQRIRGKRQGQDRRVRGVYLAVDRRGREVPRQEGEGRIDGRLDLLLGNVEREVQTELQRDDGTASGARGGHLGEARHLAELALERRRDRRGHDIGACTGIEGADLDGRVIDLRQRGDRQLLVRHGSGKENSDHQERGCDRPLDEDAGDVHLLCLGGVGAPLFLSLHLDLAAVPEPVRAVHDHKLADRQPRCDGRVPFLDDPDGDGTQCCRLVCFHHVDERALRSPLNGRWRHDDGIVLDFDDETGIDELVRKELIVPVREFGLELDRARVRDRSGCLSSSRAPVASFRFWSRS